MNDAEYNGAFHNRRKPPATFLIIGVKGTVLKNETSVETRVLSEFDAPKEEIIDKMLAVIRTKLSELN